mmetsp:Transcript_10537/g.27506  ORF Transcript_10537/g.27506 Transcript_10537/m.27506 type:complete len:856 (+) Transcript_10537:104-2671(+)
MPFLPFLPNDDKGIKDAATDCCVQLISADLGHLLKQDAKSFWSTVLNDTSLHVCIDSYLRFKRRGHDRRADDVQGTSAAEQQLARRVLMVLMRMVTSYEDGKGAPPDAERARCLYDRWLLDVPKLLDVAALYGPANPRLVSQFLSSVFTLQPQYKGDVQGIVPPLIANLGSVLQQATAAARAASRGDAAAFASLCDDGTYMLDVCATLGAFVSCYPAGAALLLAPGPGSLIGALTEVHDQLLPLLLRHIKSSASAPSASATSSTSSAQLSQQDLQLLRSHLAQLGPGLQRLTFQLLTNAYLRNHGNLTSGAAGTSSSSGIDHKAAEERGNELMAVIMYVAAPAMFEDDGPSAAAAGGSGSEPQLLQDMQRRLRLDVEVMGAMRKGALVLDDTQLDYLLALLGSDRRKAEAAAAAAGPSTSYASTSTSAPAGAGTSSRSTSAAADGAGPSTSASSLPADAAAKVAQIKEVMGDAFGDGFLHACLHAYKWEPEQVLHHILEGSLNPELQALDTSMRTWSPPAVNGSLSWSGLAAGAADLSRQESAAAAAHAARMVPEPAQAPQKRSQMHRGVARILSRVDEEARSATRALAGDMQWEYDDEYDDSFDDLLRTGADGVADVEGDEIEQSTPRMQQPTKGLGGYEDEPDDSFGRPATGMGRDAAGARAASQKGRGLPPGAAAAAAAALRPRQQQQQQQQSQNAYGQAPANIAGRGGRGGKGAQTRGKLWVLDGRIYNYPKPGAQEVGSQAEAGQVLQAGREAAKEIYGLGPGGNKPRSAPLWTLPPQEQQQQPDDEQEQEVGGGAEGSSSLPQQGGGRGGRGRQGGGRGGPNYARKEANKAAVANHHRKDRAFKKMGMF